MTEPELLIRRLGYFHAHRGEIARLIRLDGKAQSMGIGDDKAVAAIGGVNDQRANAADLQRRVQPVRERNDITDRDAFRFAVAT
jgi:hypothetical protein